MRMHSRMVRTRKEALAAGKHWRNPVRCLPSGLARLCIYVSGSRNNQRSGKFPGPYLHPLSSPPPRGLLAGPLFVSPTVARGSFRAELSSSALQQALVKPSCQYCSAGGGRGQAGCPAETTFLPTTAPQFGDAVGWRSESSVDVVAPSRAITGVCCAGLCCCREDYLACSVARRLNCGRSSAVGCARPLCTAERERGACALLAVKASGWLLVLFARAVPVAPFSSVIPFMPWSDIRTPASRALTPSPPGLSLSVGHRAPCEAFD